MFTSTFFLRIAFYANTPYVKVEIQSTLKYIRYFCVVLIATKCSKINKTTEL